MAREAVLSVAVVTAVVFSVFGIGKKVFLKRGSFQKHPLSRRFRDSRDSRELQSVKNTGDADHFLEYFDRLDSREILEIHLSSDSFSGKTPL